MNGKIATNAVDVIDLLIKRDPKLDADEVVKTLEAALLIVKSCKVVAEMFGGRR